MPYFDGTGPLGRGPLTGRGFGPCGDGYGFGFGRRGRGRGFGGGFFGFGRGYGRGYGMRPLTSAEEKEVLEDYRDSLKEELSAVDKELEGLE